MPPALAVEAVREAFVAYARREWSMPPKVYVPAYPADALPPELASIPAVKPGSRAAA